MLVGQTPAMMDIPTLLDGAGHLMQMNAVWRLETFCSMINYSLDFRIPEPAQNNVQSDGFIEVQFMRTPKQSPVLKTNNLDSPPQKKKLC